MTDPTPEEPTADPVSARVAATQLALQIVRAQWHGDTETAGVFVTAALNAGAGAPVMGALVSMIQTALRTDAMAGAAAPDAVLDGWEASLQLYEATGTMFRWPDGVPGELN